MNPTGFRALRGLGVRFRGNGLPKRRPYGKLCELSLGQIDISKARTKNSCHEPRKDESFWKFRDIEHGE